MIWVTTLGFVFVAVLLVLLFAIIVASVLHVKHEREWAEENKSDLAAAHAAWDLVATK